jgi:hypothetical protein
MKNTILKTSLIITISSLLFSCVTDRDCGKCMEVDDIKYLNNANTEINLIFYKSNIANTAFIIRNNKDTILNEFNGLFANEFDSVHILYDSTKIRRVTYNSNTNCTDNRNIFCVNNYSKSFIYAYTFTEQDYIDADTLR